MAVKSFNFSSPGVFINEIDKSQLPQEPTQVGPIIVGRALRGPAMRPITVSSYEEFVQVFGEPVAGGDSSGDVWRSGTPSGPTYGAYAAQAWLANNPTLTYVRLLGVQSDTAVDSGNNTGYAGWKFGPTTSSGKSGSFGLFVFPSSSDGAALTGALAAVWYCSGTVPVLSGTLFGSSSASAKASNGSFKVSENGKFVVQMSGTVGVDKDTKKEFDFSPTSGYFIRKAFNTNPQNANVGGAAGPASGDSDAYGYWLGETFENDLFDGRVMSTLTSSTQPLVGIIAPLNNFHTARLGYSAKDDYSARTGWIISQVAYGKDPNYVPATTASKLFRFIALDAGDWIRNNLKITINNITPPQNDAQKYGTFDVEIRKINDTDANKKIVESFSGCTLDPTSPSYVARKIGDTRYSWDDAERRLEEIGLYPNASKFVRVEMYSDNLDSSFLPFGVLGPLKYEDVVITSLTGAASGFIGALSSSENYSATGITGSGISPSSFKFTFPSLRTRVSSSEDSLPNYKLADWGASTTRAVSSILYNDGINDLLRLPVTGDPSFTSGVSGNGLTYAWQFSLDDIKVFNSGSSNKYFTWTSGSKAGGTSYTSVSGTFADLLNEGVNSFTTVFQGGTDGFNILEGEPLRNSAMSSNSTNDNSYVYYTYRRAIDTISDPEFVEANLISIPGLAFEPLTQYATQIAEQRGDALAVIDCSGGDTNKASYITQYENSANTTTRAVSVDNVVRQIKGRNLNTSYGATYYPWVQISDANSGKIITVPPTVPAIGAMSYTDRVQAPWFAPAGFNRGGLSTGNAGVNVVNVVKKLNQSDRDKLYLVNINPITSFPNEGIVIFGQKTLQATPSALDRINVRRLMLYIERGLKLISNTILFEPNVEDTWNNFKDKAEPFLSDVKARYGVEDFRLILDSTTTTPDLIDQNILYAKILVKPTRAIEFIALDFELTRSGVNFNI